MLDKLQKQIPRTAGPLLAASLEFFEICQLKGFLGITLIDLHLN